MGPLPEYGAVEAAIRAAETTPEAKQAALRRLPEVRAQAINYFFTELSKHEGFEEQLDGYGGSQDEALQHFLDDANQSPHWTQIRNRVLGGFMGLLTSGAGSVAGLTGHDDAHTAMELFSGKQGAYELKASMVDTNGFTRAVSKVGGAAPSLIPALTVGRFAGWAGKFAGLSPQATQTLAMLVSSITAAMTQAGGANGVEAVFRGAGARELVKRTLWERAKMVGIDMTEEALEEGTDQLLQGIVGSFNHRRDLTHEQILDEAVEAAWIGGPLGGTVSGVQEGSQALWDKDGKLHEAVTRGPVDEPMEGVVMPSSEGGAGGNDSAGSDSRGPDGDIWKPSIGGGEPYEVEEEGGSQEQPRVAFSRGEELAKGRQMVKQMQEIAQPGAFRRGPASQAKDFAGIVRDYALTLDEASVEETEYPYSADASATYKFSHKQGGEALIFVGKDGTVWVSSPDMRGAVAASTASRQDTAQEQTSKGIESQYIQGGDLLYQAAMTLAYNNGLKFMPDAAVSEIAKLRRNSHLLSSALRHGTTRHLSPFSEKTNANDSVAAQWKTGDSQDAFEHNLELLANQELRNVASVLSGKGTDIANLRYDQASDSVQQQTKNSDGTLSSWQGLSKEHSRALLEGLDPGNSGVGPTTLSRALVIKSALDGPTLGQRPSRNSETEETIRRGRGDFSAGAKLQRVLGTRERPEELFYSRGESSGSERVQRTGVTQAETSAAEARLKSTAQGRAIYGNVLVVDNRAALDGLQGRPRQQRYHAEDWDIMRDAEGFHDPRDGTVVIFRDNVRVLEGETAAQALARVVVHERVGHHGFDALRASDSKFAEEWKKLAAAIPADQMKELEARYTHLKGNRDALALEWFAHQVGNMEGRVQLEPGSVMQRMWQAMRDWVTRYYNPLGDASKGMTQDVIDAHVRGLIRATQRGMVKGAKKGSTHASSMAPNSEPGSTIEGEGRTLLSDRPQFALSNSDDATPDAPTLDEATLLQRLNGRVSRIDKFTGAGVEKRVALSKDLPDGEYLFVVDESGAMWTLPFAERLKHNSLVKGREIVKAAGEITVENGLVDVNARSGHFYQFEPLLGAEIQTFEKFIKLKIEKSGLKPGNISSDHVN